MRKNARQYTIRNVPPDVHRVLSRRAKETGKSFNQVALETLALGAARTLHPKRDFRDVIGSLSEKEAARIEREIRLQRQIDPELWK